MIHPRVAKYIHLVCSRDLSPNCFVLNFLSAKDIYAWSKTPLGKIKVVIIGQGKVDSSIGGVE